MIESGSLLPAPKSLKLRARRLYGSCFPTDIGGKFQNLKKLFLVVFCIESKIKIKKKKEIFLYHQ